MRIPTSKQDKGFTLIELLVVVVIIGILAAVAIPVFLNQRQKAANSATQSDLKNAATVMETYFVEDQTYANVVEGDFQTTDPVALVIAATTDATQYCIDGTNVNGDTTYFYDSDAGGLMEGTCATGEVTP